MYECVIVCMSACIVCFFLFLYGCHSLTNKVYYIIYSRAYVVKAPSPGRVLTTTLEQCGPPIRINSCIKRFISAAFPLLCHLCAHHGYGKRMQNIA